MGRGTKLISVVIPAFNAEATIIRALESVLNQSYKKLEIIVVNDGSNDDTQILVENFKNTSKVDLSLINVPNRGVSAARNTGIRLSKGDFIALLDADDEWAPEKLESQLARLIDPSLAIDFLTCLRNNEMIGFPYRFENGLAKVTLKKLLLKVVGQTSTAIFKRQITSTVGFFDESQKYSEDANYWMRVSLRHNIYIEDKSYVTTGGGKASYGESGLSSNLVEMEQGVRKNIREVYSLGEINTLEFCAFYSFAMVKFCIRKIRVKLR